MSFERIFSRISRLMHSLREKNGEGDDLRRAQELIDEANRRDRQGDRADEAAEEEKSRLRRVIAAVRRLGLEPPVTLEEATRAWRAELYRVHPDRNEHLSDLEKVETARRTRELNEAYAIVKEHFTWNR